MVDFSSMYIQTNESLTLKKSVVSTFCLKIDKKYNKSHKLHLNIVEKVIVVDLLLIDFNKIAKTNIFNVDVSEILIG